MLRCTVFLIMGNDLRQIEQEDGKITLLRDNIALYRL